MAIVVAPRIARSAPSSTTSDTSSPPREISRAMREEMMKAELAKQRGRLHDQMVRSPRCGILPIRPYEDASAGLAIERLRRTPGIISGDAMADTILDAIRDLDGNGASAEYRDLRRFADANWHRLSPEARRAFRTYEREALRAQAEGQEGIPASRLPGLEERLRRAGGEGPSPWRAGDESVQRALAPLRGKDGPITSSDILSLFGATLDQDGQMFGQEHRDIARFVDDNWERMTPGARAAFQRYDEAARAAQADGRSGGSFFDVATLLQSMWRSADLADDRRLMQPLRG